MRASDHPCIPRPDTMTDAEIVAHIKKRRTQLCIHRYLYYVKSQPLISDYDYDMLERDLKKHVTEHPELAAKADISMLCPLNTVGSSDPDAYSRQIEQLAESLLAHSNHY